MELVLLSKFILQLNIEGPCKHVDHPLIVDQFVFALELGNQHKSLIQQLILQTIRVQILLEVELLALCHRSLLEQIVHHFLVASVEQCLRRILNEVLTVTQFVH
jgi:hypothetical protein